DGPSAEIERHLQTGKPVLIVGTNGLTKDTLQILSTHPNLAIVNPDRYLPSRQLIRQQLDADKLGAPGLIRIHRWEPDTPPPPTRKRPDGAETLRRDLDLVLWYAGAMPNVVYTALHARGMQIHLGFAAGAMALLDHATMPADEAYYAFSL